MALYKVCLFVWYWILFREVLRLGWALSGELPYAGFWTWEVKFTLINLDNYYAFDGVMIPVAILWIALLRSGIKDIKALEERKHDRKSTNSEG